MENNWNRLWSGRTADQMILQSGDLKKIFMELKRTNGFDVIKDQISYETFLGQYHELVRNLSLRLPDGAEVHSVYEVGCGSGANLLLLEQDGITCGGIDYSAALSECAKQVLRTTDIRCDEACELPVEPKYDAVISVSVFGYFIDEEYAEITLEKMCQKANYSVGILELADIKKKEAYTAHRKEIIPDYEERYKGLPRQFYSREFFEAFACKHDMDIEVIPVSMKDYWNSQFYFDCYLYKR